MTNHKETDSDGVKDNGRGIQNALTHAGVRAGLATALNPVELAKRQQQKYGGSFSKAMQKTVKRGCMVGASGYVPLKGVVGFTGGGAYQESKERLKGKGKLAEIAGPVVIAATSETVGTLPFEQRQLNDIARKQIEAGKTGYRSPPTNVRGTFRQAARMAAPSFKRNVPGYIGAAGTAEFAKRHGGLSRGEKAALGFVSGCTAAAASSAYDKEVMERAIRARKQSAASKDLATCLRKTRMPAGTAARVGLNGVYAAGFLLAADQMDKSNGYGKG